MAFTCCPLHFILERFPIGSFLVLLIYWMAYKSITQPELYLFQNPNTAITIDENRPALPVDWKEPLENNSVLLPENQVRKYQKSGLEAETAVRLYSRLLAYMDT